MNTPWGWSDWSKTLAPGVTSVSTPGHGGIHVTPEVRAKWPAALRDIRTFAGGDWYEEDLDACIVIVAMPELFRDSIVVSAALGLASWAKQEQRLAPFTDWLASDSGSKVRRIVEDWQRENADNWERGGMGSCAEGWEVTFRRVHDGVRTTRIVPSYPEKRIYTTAELPGRPA